MKLFRVIGMKDGKTKETARRLARDDDGRGHEGDRVANGGFPTAHDYEVVGRARVRLM